MNFLCFSDHIGVLAFDSDVEGVRFDPRPGAMPAKAIRSIYYRQNIYISDLALLSEREFTCDDDRNWFCHFCVKLSVSKGLVQ